MTEEKQQIPTIKLVRCERCYAEQKNIWLRLENTIPVEFIGQIINPTLGQFKSIIQPIFLCKEHYEEYCKLESWAESPKN